ncbi:MAG: ATP-binding cassette domain-containing protein [Pseudomonadota bacterium]
MIQLQHVSKCYDNQRLVLNNVCLTIPQGQFVILRGSPGSGKTTFIQLLALLEKPTQGSILVGAQQLETTRVADIPAYRRTLGLITQTPQLLFDQTVLNNVMLSLQITMSNGTDHARRARAALDKVGLLPKGNVLPERLSFHEQQRLCVARALVHRPTLVLADNPAGAMPIDIGQGFLDIFEQFHQHGTTVVVTTHDAHLSPRRPHRVLVLSHGALVEDYLVTGATIDG